VWSLRLPRKLVVALLLRRVPRTTGAGDCVVVLILVAVIAVSCRLARDAVDPLSR